MLCSCRQHFGENEITSRWVREMNITNINLYLFALLPQPIWISTTNSQMRTWAVALKLSRGIVSWGMLMWWLWQCIKVFWCHSSKRLATTGTQNSLLNLFIHLFNDLLHNFDDIHNKNISWFGVSDWWPYSYEFQINLMHSHLGPNLVEGAPGSGKTRFHVRCVGIGERVNSSSTTYMYCTGSYATSVRHCRCPEFHQVGALTSPWPQALPAKKWLQEAGRVDVFL